MSILHIVNGDSMVNKLTALTLGENILVWREALYEGPLPQDLASKETQLLRAAYFAEAMGLPEDQFLIHSEEQYKALAEHGSYDQIILWFEHDLFDQTMLIYLLSWFAKFKAPQTKLQLLCIGEYPGIPHFLGLAQLTIEQLATLSGQWHEVSAAELHLASKAWKVYASSNPLDLQQFLTEEDLSPLPFLQSALLCHLRRFPSVSNGLGLIEQRALQLISEGLTKLVPLFQHISVSERNYGFGDMQFWRYLERLAGGKHPLIRWTGPGSLPRMNGKVSKKGQEWKIEITDNGKAVLQNKADFVELNGIHRWLGGVLLTEGAKIWRWDEGKRILC